MLAAYSELTSLDPGSLGGIPAAFGLANALYVLSKQRGADELKGEGIYLAKLAWSAGSCRMDNTGKKDVVLTL